jgi:arabinoxylan arabinofuranohydrolase
MSAKQAINPYLPDGTYIPDGEPHVFHNRVYIYGSHDRYKGLRYCPGDYVVWSAPVDDLSAWSNNGVSYRRRGKYNALGLHCLWAPDCCQGTDGFFYLYYCFDFHNAIYVARSAKPDGPFAYYGQVVHQNRVPYGQGKEDIMCFDPGVFVDDDGRIYLYSGFSANSDLEKMLRSRGIKNVSGNGNQVAELEKDMLTVKGEPKMLIPGYMNSRGTGFEGHEMYEASSMRKINGRYYFIYSSRLSHELSYAVSDKPDSGFHYMGPLISNGDIGYRGQTEKDATNYWGNNHGSLICLNGQWFVFYHRQTARSEQSRQGCAEPIEIKPDGSISMVEMTSCGLNVKPLPAAGTYPAYMACNLIGPRGSFKCAYSPFSFFKYRHEPYIGQYKHGKQCLKNMTDGSAAGFKYFAFDGLTILRVKVRGFAGKIMVSLAYKGPLVGEIDVRSKRKWTSFFTFLEIPKGNNGLFLTFNGKGKAEVLEIGFEKFKK